MLVPGGIAACPYTHSMRLISASIPLKLQRKSESSRELFAHHNSALLILKLLRQFDFAYHCNFEVIDN